MQFTLSVPAPGKYQVLVRYKTGPDRGTFRARLDSATDVGAEVDGYSASPGYITKVLDVVDIATAGPHTVTLQVTGKSGGSTGYGISVDYIELRPNPVINKISIGMEPVTLEATFGCATPPDPQTKTGVADSAAPVSFTIPGQIPIIVGNAGNHQAKLVFQNGTDTAVTCTYQGGASASHPTTTLDLIKGLKYQFQSCSNGSQPGAAALATNFQLSLLGADCEYSMLVTKARVHLGGSQCTDAVADFVSPDDTYTMRTQFSWAATQPVAETDAAGNPTLWYAMIYIHDDRQPDVLDSLLIHHQKPPVFLAPGQTLPKLCGKLESTGDGEGYFEHALLTAVAFNKLRALALAAGPDLASQRLFKVIKIVTPPVAPAANADGSVSIDYLLSTGFRYMGYLAGQTVTHPDGTSDVIARPQFDWLGDLWDGIKGGGEWVLARWGDLLSPFWPSVTLSAHLRAFSNDPVFEGQPLLSGSGWNAGKEIGIPGVQVTFWYTPSTELINMAVGTTVCPYGATTDGNGRLTVNVPALSEFVLAEIPLDSVAAKITWNGGPTHTIRATPGGLSMLTGDTSTEIDDASYLNALAQFSNSYDYLRTVVHYVPRQVKVAEGFAVNILATANNNNAVTTCGTFPNLVFDGAKFVSWMLNDVLWLVFPPAMLAATVFESALNSDMWLPDSDQAVFNSRGMWTHEYGHYAFCNMIDSNGAALSVLTKMTLQSIFSGTSIDPSDETRILNEAFADFFAAQVVGGTNYYSPPNPVTSDYISYCVAPLCLEENRSETGTGHEVIARDITLFMDAFDGLNFAASTAPNAGDSWFQSSTSPPTLAYASQKYADSCLAGRAANSPNYWSSCDEFVFMSGPNLFDWVTDWLAHSSSLNHNSFMTALAHTVRTKGEFTWCDVCRLFAIHTPGNEKTPQELGLSTPVPITQYSDACLNSFIKDWIGPPPDPSLTNLDRIFNPQPYFCEVCPVGSTPGPDRCICGPHEIPGGFANVNCLQCAADQIAITIGPNWYCVSCGNGVPIDGQNLCQCNPGAIQAPDGTCVGACGNHQIWQGGQCVDCDTESFPDPTKTVCISCPPATPLCEPYEMDGMCYGDCVAACPPGCYLPPLPGSTLCVGPIEGPSCPF